MSSGAPRRVLMVSQPTSAGVAQCALDWAVGVAHRGWEAVVACPDDGPLQAWCEDAGIPAVTWRADRSPRRGIVAETRALSRVIAQVAPTVVMLHSSKAGLDGRLALRGRLPTAFVPHAWSFDASGGLEGRGALAWEKWAARWADVVLCVSDAERLRGVEAGIRARYRVVRNGVDFEQVTGSVAPGKAALRQRLGEPVDVELVVCVGRLARQKGQDVLLAAWPSVAQESRRLVLVGGGPDREMLESAAAGRSDVRFTGDATRDEVLAWLGAADVVVVPSRWEGMALVPLEAMAAGAPVIASDVTGISEAVPSQAGELVRPDDPAELADALNRWLSLDVETRAAAGAEAREWVSREFSLEVTLDGVAAVLAEAAAR